MLSWASGNEKPEPSIKANQDFFSSSSKFPEEKNVSGGASRAREEQIAVNHEVDFLRERCERPLRLSRKTGCENNGPAVVQ